jgi:hypothetical protein
VNRGSTLRISAAGTHSIRFLYVDGVRGDAGWPPSAQRSAPRRAGPVRKWARRRLCGPRHGNAHAAPGPRKARRPAAPFPATRPRSVYDSGSTPSVGRRCQWRRCRQVPFLGGCGARPAHHDQSASGVPVLREPPLAPLRIVPTTSCHQSTCSRTPRAPRRLPRGTLRKATCRSPHRAGGKAEPRRAFHRSADATAGAGACNTAIRP